MELRDLKVGNFVRTRYGIGKIDDTQMFMNKYFQVHLDTNKGKIYSIPDNSYWNDEKDIIKASDKLIDLVDVGDYVNGMEVIAIDSDGRLYVPEDLGQPYDRVFSNGCFYHTLLDMNTFKIKSIVTKEMFDQMSYKVGE